MIRPSVKEDITAIMAIIEETILDMRTYGNTQWDESYPTEAVFLEDIEKKNLFTYEENGEVGGIICVNTIEPNEYAEVTAWRQQGVAMVVHRVAIAMKMRKKGIATQLLTFAEQVAAEKGIPYLKTDTYSVNSKMNTLFSKLGYKLCGTIHFMGREKEFNCYDKEL